MPTSIAFVGLGIMGRPMASRLMEAGHSLRVHARRHESMAPLEEQGAQACTSPSAAADGAQVIFVMVADTADVEAVILGDRGVLAGASPGAVVVDMSTISPSATRAMARRLAEHDLTLLDAPVSGGEAGARDGTLSIMVGGPGEALQQVRPLLEILGRQIVHIGDHGAGQVAKACNQLLVGQTIAAVAEALLLARGAGVDPHKVREALLGGMAYSRILENHGQRMLSRDFQPGFKSRLHRKDLRIALETAAEHGLALPGTALASQYLNALQGQDRGEQDSAAVVTLLEALNDLALESD